jgi:motility quorum-sensing regulator/GCU-specific mRNA interferase toxin
MEKRTAHYPLAIVKSLLEQGRVKMTQSAVIGARMLALTEDDIISTVKGLSMRDFYKSMTTYADHRVWQDVYRPRTSAGDVYLKLIVSDDLVIVSFKEL